MDRIAVNQLLTWKNDPDRKPLIVEGARQVGKTWLVKEFAKRHYKNIAYINFEEEVYMRSLFETDYNIPRIIAAIVAATHVECDPQTTLIFFDEIQEAPGGITALKYFYENAPEYHVVVAGSLLGIELHKQVSFPVGKVQFFSLRPMNFAEFLSAMGEGALANFIAEKNWTTLEMFAPKLQELLKSYYYVGGMPRAVLEFSQTQNWQKVRAIQTDILNGYDRDFSKHTPKEIVPRIRQIWNSLPSQLSKENRKFIYGLVREGARAREYEIALQWLFDSGLIHKVSNVSAPRIPLKGYEELSTFKIFSVDVGLLGAMSELDSRTIVEGNRIFTQFKGALTEQYVLQELILKHRPYYFAKANAAQEIDFLLQIDGEVIPLEVKAEENLKAKSLKQFIKDNSTATAYRLCMKPHSRDGAITNIPLYCAGTI